MADMNDDQATAYHDQTNAYARGGTMGAAQASRTASEGRGFRMLMTHDGADPKPDAPEVIALRKRFDYWREMASAGGMLALKIIVEITIVAYFAKIAWLFLAMPR